MAEKKLKKKLFGCLKVVLYFALALVCLFAIWLAINYRGVASEGQPLVAVSSETTHITQPLDSNGDVDYIAALNLRCSEGVTTENNALVKYAEAFGPIHQNPDISAGIFEQLKIEPLAKEGDYFVGFETWLHKENERRYEANLAASFPSLDADMEGPESVDSDGPELGLDATESATELDLNHDEIDTVVALDQFEYAKQHPWTVEQFPEIANWIESNEAAIGIAREGLKRSHYFHPLVAGGFPKVMTADLGYVLKFSELEEFLSVSAMSHLQRGDWESCFQDIESLYILGRHVLRGPTIVEELSAIKLINSAFESSAAVCASGKANPEQLRELLQWADQLELPDDMAERIDQTDRYMGLDAAVSMARSNSFGSGPVSDTEAKLGMLAGLIEWPETLQILNTNYDRFVEVAKIKDPEELDAAWDQLQQSMVANEVWVMNNITKSAVLGRKSKGIWTGRMLSGMLMPEVYMVSDSETSCKAQHQMLRLAIAASIFKKENGQLPKSLEVLAPQYIPALPPDPLSGKPFVLEIIDGGFRVHSPLWENSPNPKSGIFRNAKRVLEVTSTTWE